ncbi:MAG: CAP domain-containing protein [Acidimicrobiia bacterium]|nr:CAP domain-containing protein [Acidimicrobiia bacterium]
MAQVPTKRNRVGRNLVRLPLILATVAFFSLTACFPAISQPHRYSSSPTERIKAEILDQLNAERHARGLPLLVWNPNLAGMAQNWSQHMADSGSFSHRDLSGAFKLSPFNTTLSAMGENILRGPASLRSGATTTAFMKSSGHRHNILAPGFDSVGIGVVCKGGKIYVTHNFGRATWNHASTASSAPQDPIKSSSSSGTKC